MATTIKVNGVDRTVDIDGDTPLLWVLRDVFGMTGTKFGCAMALCCACTVHVDGAATRSCITISTALAAPRSQRSRQSARQRRVPRSRRPGSTGRSFNAATRITPARFSGIGPWAQQALADHESSLAPQRRLLSAQLPSPLDIREDRPTHLPPGRRQGPRALGRDPADPGDLG